MEKLNVFNKASRPPVLFLSHSTQGHFYHTALKVIFITQHAMSF